jgi:hypothetical protein
LRGLGGLGSLAGATGANSPTAAVNQQALAYQASWVRNYYNYYNHFRGDWWNRERAWRAAGWAKAATAYGTATWAVAYGYCGYGYTEPAYYDYGSNVVYECDNVYVNGDTAGTQEEYAQQATSIADTGKQARANGDGEWLPLGVFAMVYGEQKNSSDNFQLAVNKSGVIRGNYYNALTDTTLPVFGSVDEKTQRAAWTVGDGKERVFEAGFGNLTKAETTMLVHFGTERTQQWTLVRLDGPREPR